METLQIDMTFNLIQQIRLIHALSESNYPISIHPAEESKFDKLRQYFGIQFASTNANSVDITNQLTVSHAEPITAIGQIARPLIFPHAITDYCRTLWKDRRNYRYSFQGLITEKREKLLEDWIADKLKKRFRLNTTFFKLKKKAFAQIGLDTAHKRRVGELLLWESDRGRKFPIKAWDDSYFRVLANSKFVLCPSGDCIWSYRFFESALCGAIPIVEKDCSTYCGFRFLSMQDDVSAAEWSREAAEHNYKTCVELLTIPGEILNAEIARMLKSGG